MQNEKNFESLLAETDVTWLPVEPERRYWDLGSPWWRRRWRRRLQLLEPRDEPSLSARTWRPEPAGAGAGRRCRRMRRSALQAEIVSLRRRQTATGSASSSTIGRVCPEEAIECRFTPHIDYGEVSDGEGEPEERLKRSIFGKGTFRFTAREAGVSLEVGTCSAFW